MIDFSSPTVRQRKFSANIKKSVSLFFRKIEFSINNSPLICSRIVSSKDLQNIDIFMTSDLSIIDSFEASLLAKKVEIDNNITSALKKDIQKSMTLKYIPSIEYYLY